MLKRGELREDRQPSPVAVVKPPPVDTREHLALGVANPPLVWSLGRLRCPENAAVERAMQRPRSVHDPAPSEDAAVVANPRLEEPCDLLAHLGEAFDVLLPRPKEVGRIHNSLMLPKAGTRPFLSTSPAIRGAEIDSPAGSLLISLLDHFGVYDRIVPLVEFRWEQYIRLVPPNQLTAALLMSPEILAGPLVPLAD